MKKPKKTFFWIIISILSIIFFSAGISKLMGAEIQLNNFTNWGYPDWSMMIIGVIELIFCFGLLMSKYRKSIINAIYVWGGLAVLTHIVASEFHMLVAPFIIVSLTYLSFIFSKRLKLKPAK